MMKTTFSAPHQVQAPEPDARHVKICAVIKTKLDELIDKLVDFCDEGQLSDGFALKTEIERLNWLHSMVMQKGFKTLDEARKKIDQKAQAVELGHCNPLK